MNRKLLRNALIVLAVVFPIFSIVVIREMRKAPENGDLPVYWKTPTFSLIDQDSTPFSDAGLQGSVWLVGFVYTHCPDVCPLITQRMAVLRDSLNANERTRGKVRLLSISVDPLRDRPAELRDYALRFKAAKPEWVFLTGPLESVIALVNQGFHLGTIHPRVHTDHEQEHRHDSIAGDYMVSHSDRIVLVDADRQVRGTYVSSEPEELVRLRRDVVGIVGQRGE